MPEPLEIDLPFEQRRLIQIMAQAGVVGETEEEVVAYMVTRHLDDLLRSGCVKLGIDE